MQSDMKHTRHEISGISDYSLCPFDEVFLEKSFNWLQKPEIRKGMDIHFQMDQRAQREWYDNLPYRKDYVIWGFKYKDEPIGAGGFRNITSDSGELTCYIGEQNHLGGVGKVLVSLLVEKAISMQWKAIYLKVLHDNTRAYRLYLNQGFVEYDVNVLFSA